MSKDLKVRNLEKSYPTENGPLAILKKVSFSLEAGEKLAITGESGSGKSTLLHLIGALDTPDAGEIEIAEIRLSTLNDRERAAVRRMTVGIIFQQFNLIPSLNAMDNVRLHARLAYREDTSWINYLMEKLKLSEFALRYPEQLSGGQQQRVAIARTLAARPDVILADEPTGNLDERSAETVFKLMTELVEETGKTLIVVTHSTLLASQLPKQLRLHSGQLA